MAPALYRKLVDCHTADGLERVVVCLRKRGIEPKTHCYMGNTGDFWRVFVIHRDLRLSRELLARRVNHV